MNKNNSDTTEIPIVDWGLTPITDGMFERQGWTKILISDIDNNVFYQVDDIEDELEFSEYYDSTEEDDELRDDDMNSDPDDINMDDAYYWVLKLPRDNSIELNNGCPTLVSSLSNEKINGLKKGQYFVQIHDFFDLGICFSEEEIEILYRSLCSKDIYDFK